MIQVTEDALAKLKELLGSEGGEQSAIRVAVMGGGSKGPGLGLVVDEAAEEDKRYEVGGIALIIDRALISYCSSVTIDFTIGKEGKCGGASGSGFLIVPENPVNL
ncbi:MAG: hypothetical protein P8X86_04770 [Desulfofustis sp.]|jgi:Fe-S cluster assembly iron-binding protein IscA